MLGSGIIITKQARLIITGTSGNIPTANFVVINTTNFANLSFAAEVDGLIDFVDTTGIFTTKDYGVIEMSATLNVQADQASAEFLLIPQFDFGDGWVVGLPRKKILTAIKPDQLSFYGMRIMPKGTLMRFWVKAASGNIIFSTETLDPAGALEAILPAAIFNVKLNRLTARQLI